MSLFYILMAGLLLFTGKLAYRTWAYHRQLKAYSLRSATEWGEIQELAKDPDRHEEAVRRFAEKTKDTPPPPPC